MARKRPIVLYSGKRKEIQDGDSLNGYTSQSANYNHVQGINFIDMDATGGNRTVTLLGATTFGVGNLIRIRKTDSSTNTVTVSSSSGTLQGLSSYVLMVQYDTVSFVSDGTNWTVVSSYTPAIWSTPTRVVNTNYTPAATRNMRVAITVRITLPTSAAAQGGRIEFRSDSAATPTTVVTQSRQTQDIGGLLSGGLTGGSDCELVYDLPAGHQYRIVPVTENGAPTYSIIVTKERPI